MFNLHTLFLKKFCQQVIIIMILGDGHCQQVEA